LRGHERQAAEGLGRWKAGGEEERSPPRRRRSRWPCSLRGGARWIWTEGAGTGEGAELPGPRPAGRAWPIAQRCQRVAGARLQGQEAQWVLSPNPRVSLERAAMGWPSSESSALFCEQSSSVRSTRRPNRGRRGHPSLRMILRRRKAHLLHRVGGSCLFPTSCDFENGLDTLSLRPSQTEDKFNMGAARVEGQRRKLERPCPSRRESGREKRNPCR